MAASHQITRFLLVFAVFVTLALTAGSVQAGAPPQESFFSDGSLASFLDEDGRLNLPSGFSGSLNAEGWQLVSRENEPPRFLPLGSARSSTPLANAGSSTPLGSTVATAPRVAGDEKWLPGFNLRGAIGTVLAVVAGAGSDVYIGGSFPTMGDVRAASVAKWDGSHWSALGYGLNGVTNALAWDGTNNILYAGGDFDFVCGATDCSTTQVNHIAKWSGGAWSALSYGLTDNVLALALDSNNDLYVGGQFLGYCTMNATCPANTTVNRIAKWNRTGGNWSALTHGGTGVGNIVRALAWLGPLNQLVVGGDFLTAWGLAANHLAAWTPPAAHGQVCGGVDGNVRALAWDSTHQALFVGGDFDNLNASFCGAATQANHIAKYTLEPATSWVLDHGVDGPVYSIVLDATNQKAFIGGDFGRICSNNLCDSGTDVRAVAQWDYSGAGAWSTLGTGIEGTVYALALNSGLYAGGGFNRAGDAIAFNIAKWNSPNWSALGMGSGVSSAMIYAVAADGRGNVYVGGLFQAAGGVRANNIAKWDGSNWSAFDKGLLGPVQAIAVDKDGRVYAGGAFQYACGDVECYYNGTRVNSIAKWDGTGWSPVGNGFLPGSGVPTLTLDKQGNLIAGGTIPGICNNIDCSNPPTFSHNVVKWTAPSGPWSPVGGGTNGPVYALAVDSANKVYVGGDFAFVCGDANCSGPWVQVNRIAKWTGTAWEALGFGVDAAVKALAADRTDKLYVGGDMTKACGDLLACGTNLVQLNRIGRWTPGSPGTWDKLGYGVTSPVTGLVVDDANNLFASGFFGLCGNDACGSPTMVNGVAKWNGSAWSSLGSGVWPSMPVNGLAWQFGRLSVGGLFFTAGDKVSSNFAQYQDNNPPTLVHISKTGYPGGTLPFTAAEFSGAMTDTESEALARIQVLSLPPNGTLKLSGAAVTAGQEIAAASIPNLTFTHNAGWTGATSFSWNGHDGNSYAVTPANVNITIAFRLLYLPFVRR